MRTSPLVRIATRRRVLALGVAVLLPLTLWQAATWTRQAALAEIRARGTHALELYVTNLQGVLETYEFLPRLLARQDLVARLLRHPDDPVQIRHVNRYLQEFNAIAKASDTYIMDIRGLTLAASNWHGEMSFVGLNFGFRPYFQTALAGSTGVYFALGTTSNLPGFYFSHPVWAGDQVLGVSVVKISLERLESAWAQDAAPVIVTDGDGVIFITSRDEWRFHSLHPLSPTALERIQASLQYGNQPLRSLDVAARSYDGSTRTLTLREAGRDRHYLVQTSQVPTTQWIVHVLSPTDAVRSQMLTAMALAGLGFVILALLLLFLLQRRQNLQALLRERQRTAEALARSRDQLERRVAERTRDLQTSNQRLQQEIQDRRRAEDTLRQTQDDLIQAGKLAALGQMSAAIVHELNQPLAAIRAYAENAGVFLTRHRPDRAGENIKTIVELTGRMAELTGHLKTFARKTSEEMGPVDLRQVIRQTLTLIAPRARKLDVALVEDLPDAALTVRGNAIRLEQVLVNLCNNALDAMADGRERRLELTVRTVPGRVSLTVRDSGPGIAPAALPQLFDPFFTTKEVGEGLGLGLSISYGIIKTLGGSIRAANHPEGGAVFTVELPGVYTQ